MGSEHYCLRWNNHQNNLLGVFSQLLQDESLVDVTLACAEGHSIRAHKVVLSACSSYFQSLFVDHPGRHPIVILKDVCFSELRTLVEFMYRGEVNVEYCRLSALLKTAESLKVKGLAEMTHLRGAGGAPPRQDDSEPPRAPEQPPGPATPRPDTPPPPASQPPATPPDTARPCDDLDARSRTPDADDDLSSGHSGPSDMTISRLPSPHPTEPQPGPSGLPPVQQVPLSLKKEVDWDRAEEGDGQRSLAGESSSEYRHPHDPILNSAGMELWTSFKDGHNYTLKGHQGKEIDRLFHSLRPLENPPYGITDHYYSYYMEVCLVEGVYGPTCFPRHRGTPYDQIGSGRSTTPFTYPPFPPLPSCYPHSETLLSLLSQQGLLPPLPPTEGTLRCAVCLAGFPSAWLLEQHTALQHSGQAPRSHAPEPTEDKPFRCDQCGQSYRYRSAFLKHREQNHRARLPADKLFTCDVCGMQFRYLKSFKKHRLNHALERLHNPFHRPGSAASDSRRSERSEQSERSERSDRGDRSDTKSENSERSEGVSTSARSVNDEVTSTNEAEGSSNPPATSPCPPEQDDTVDSLALALGSNEASLLGLLRLGAEERQRERRSFACPFCGKCVRSKENLKLHVRKHTGERPFACLFCGRAFGGKSDLTRHLRIHTGERPYHCEMCGKCFARADYLSKHLTTHIHNSHHQR